MLFRYFYFTLFLFSIKVWEEIIEDLPYTVVLENLPVIFRRKQLIECDSIVLKVKRVIENLERIVAAKIHPTKVNISVICFSHPTLLINK